MVPAMNQVSLTVMESRKNTNSCSMEVNKVHTILGHCGETHLKLTVKAYDFNTFRKLEACKSCSVGKAMQKRNNNYRMAPVVCGYHFDHGRELWRNNVLGYTCK